MSLPLALLAISLGDEGEGRHVAFSTASLSSARFCYIPRFYTRALVVNGLGDVRAQGLLLQASGARLAHT